jgi:hypothetical protein
VVGKTERQICTEKSSMAKESYRSEADESGSAKEAIGTREGALGCTKKGWRYLSVDRVDRDWKIFPSCWVLVTLRTVA